MAIYQLDGLAPQLGEGVWVADSAQVIGDVQLGHLASVWFGAVLRGDSAALVIGEGSNVQDLSVLHADRGVPLHIGQGVSVGHQAMLHGCTIGDHSLIGIQSVVLNHARIGRNCLVGAGSLVTEGKVFPDNVLIMGRPARVVRSLDEEAIARLRRTAQHYVDNARRFASGLHRLA